jgi:hypothetical protein
MAFFGNISYIHFSFCMKNELFQRAFEVRNLKMTAITSEQTKGELLRRNRGDADTRLMSKVTSEYNLGKLTAVTSIDNSFIELLLEQSFIETQMVRHFYPVFHFCPFRLSHLFNGCLRK